MNLVISPRRVTRALTLVVLFLTVASVDVQLSRYSSGYGWLSSLEPLFNLHREFNVPTWFSSSMLLLCAALLAMIAFAKNMECAPYRLHWKALSVIFLYLSVDEAAGLHEMTSAPLQSAFDAGGLFYFTWVIPGVALVLVFVLAYFRFLRALPLRTRRLFLVSGFLFVGGAIGMEMVSAYFADLYGIQNLTYELITDAEEFLEMLGIVVFIHALMRYMSLYVKDSLISFDDGEPRLPPEEKRPRRAEAPAPRVLV